MSDDRFCDECGVSRDLHTDEEDCEGAAAKADLMDQFFSIFVRDRS